MTLRFKKFLKESLGKEFDDLIINQLFWVWFNDSEEEFDKWLKAKGFVKGFR